MEQLSWFERVLIKLLLRSRRIDRIILLKQCVVDDAQKQHAAPPAAAASTQNPVVQRLENLFHGPPAER
jgi:hypothetical protein